uniref:NRF domain-containing protein n=1 Tax=Panagrellus redivivus TaxID=6233 RepID=A0A7E4V1X0_PANRE
MVSIRRILCTNAVFLTLICLGSATLLIPSHIPPRPKPLDQFRLPSIKKLLDTTSAIRQLCNNQSISVSQECQKDVSHLFCSLNALATYWSTECPGKDDVEGCSKCQLRAAEMYTNSSWIMTWVDSIGKMPSGISDGNYHWLGDYEQCESLKINNLFNGHYCMIQFEVPDTVLNTRCDENRPLEVHLGICLPASCSDEEKKALIEDVAEHEMYVQCEPPKQWSWAATIFLYGSIIWGAFITILTLFVWYNRPLETWYYNIAEAVSLHHNFQKCLRTTRQTEHLRDCIPGLLVVSLFLFICGNVFYLVMPFLENVSFSYSSSQSAFMQIIVNYSFYADGILALAAFKIGTYYNNGGFHSVKDILYHLVSRFFRVWPAYAYVVGFITLIFIRLGSGPMWSHNDLPDRCLNSWWFNLLLVNNLFGIDQICFDGSYLYALDAQFYLLALLIFYISNKSRAAASVIIISAIVVSILYVLVAVPYYGTYAALIPTAITFKEQDAMYNNFVKYIYLNPVSRLAPFLIGLYTPLWINKKAITLQKYVWIATAFTVLIIWTPYLFDGTNNFYLYAIYASIHRTFWAMTILIIAYMINNVSVGNVLKAILGFKIFYPMSKLVFLVFVISEPVALSLFSSLHRPINATFFSLILTSIGTFVCSYIIAVLVQVAVALPIRYLYELCLAPQADDVQKNRQNPEEESLKDNLFT